MIQTLQRLKAKKGFTIVELIVVMAILAVLMAIVVPMLTSRKGKIDEANATARDFYTTLQSTMMKYSLYNGPLSPTYRDTPEYGFMRFYERMGGNYPYKAGRPIVDATTGEALPPETASLYIELMVSDDQIKNVVTYTSVAVDADYGKGVGMYELCQRDASVMNTELGRLLREELSERINYHDGYYYAKVTYKCLEDKTTIPSRMAQETVKVDYTGYSRELLPDASGTAFSAYRTQNMYFVEPNILANGQIFGVCAASNTYEVKAPTTTGGTDGVYSTVGLAGTALS